MFGTAALAFIIGVLALTAGELLGGGSFGNNDRRVTVVPGSAKKDSGGSESQTPRTTPEKTDTQTEPDQQTTTTEETPTPDTETTTTPTAPEQPPVEPTPTDTTPPTPTQP